MEEIGDFQNCGEKPEEHGSTFTSKIADLSVKIKAKLQFHRADVQNRADHSSSQKLSSQTPAESGNPLRIAPSGALTSRLIFVQSNNRVQSSLPITAGTGHRSKDNAMITSAYLIAGDHNGLQPDFRDASYFDRTRSSQKTKITEWNEQSSVLVNTSRNKISERYSHQLVKDLADFHFGSMS